jgi:hypothetical protein
LTFGDLPSGSGFMRRPYMLANAIDGCPDSVWTGEGPGAFWYLAFRVLFFLDLYLSPMDEDEFRPPAPFSVTELQDEPSVPEPGYGKEELLGYLEHCRYKLDGGNDRRMGGRGLSVCVSRKEQWGTAAVSRGRVRHHMAQLGLLLRQRTIRHRVGYRRAPEAALDHG